MPVSGGIITSSLLCKRLGVTYKVLYQLHQTRLLVPVRSNGANHYFTSDVNAFLEKSALGFTHPPTLQKLADNTLVLIEPEEAAAITALDQASLYRRLGDGRVAAIKVSPSRVRFSEQSAVEYAIQNNGFDHIPRTKVAHVIGFSLSLVSQLCREGRLEGGRLPGNKRVYAVTRQSLLTLLGELLPDWISPEAWLEDRLQSNQPLAHLKDAVQLLGLSKYHRVVELIKDRRLHYLVAPGGRDCYRISPDSIDAFLEREPELTHEAIAWQFGVTRPAVEQWRHTGQLNCALHNHESAALRKPCLIGIMQPLLSPGLSANRWYSRRLDSPHPLVTQQAVAKRLGIGQAEVMELAACGRLHGIRSPGGRWRFTRSELLEAYTRAQKGLL